MGARLEARRLRASAKRAGKNKRTCVQKGEARAGTRARSDGVSARGVPQIPAILAAVRAAAEAEQATWVEVRRGEKRRSPMFEFTQHLHGCPEFKGLDAHAALTQVNRALASRGYSLAGEFPDYDDPDASFMHLWNVVVFPQTWDTAVHHAQLRPIQVEPFVSQGFSDFLSLCFHLQRLCGDAPIIIPCEQFASALNVSARTVSTYRSLAVKMGMLTTISKADFYAGKAARFRCRLDFQYR